MLGEQVLGRNEPANIIRVAKAVARLKKIPLAVVAETCYKNSLKLFDINE